MAERIDVDVREVVSVVLAKWEGLTGHDIGGLAEQVAKLAFADDVVETQSYRRQADASILASLQYLKEIREGLTVPELIAIWQKVSDGDPNKAFGGMIHGEDSRHYRKALRFAEKMLLEQIVPFVEQEVVALTQKCLEEPTAEARHDAFEAASAKLREHFVGLYLDGEELEKLFDEKEDHFNQLAELEDQPRLIDQATAFVFAVHRHLVCGTWSTCAESTLPVADADRIARELTHDGVMYSISQYECIDVIEFGEGRASTRTIAYRKAAELLGQVVGPSCRGPTKAKREAPRGICEVCGKERVLRQIDSGQMICTGCYMELKPSRPKELAAYATLEAFHRKGIELPETITKAEIAKLREDMDTLHYLLMNAWHTLSGVGFDSSGGSRENLECACYALLTTGEFGQRMLHLEQQRMAIGHQLYEQIREVMRGRKHTDTSEYYLEDGVLWSREKGRDVAYWDFKPPLVRDDDDFARLRDLLHNHFPRLMPKSKGT